MLASRTKYATRALLELAMHPDQPLHIEVIAKAQNIPPKFLEQILLGLKRQGFVKSRRGPGGGYLLARPAWSITLGSVVRALEGPIAPISCASVTGYMECGCPEAGHCGLRGVWKEARDALATVLDNTNFAEIAARHGTGGGTGESADFMI